MRSFKFSIPVVVFTTLFAAACSTAGTQLENSAPVELPFDPAGTQPVTEELGPQPSTSTIDPAVVGPNFPVASAGPTMAVSGNDGVWWFDANGKEHLVVEPAVAADYDGDGGLVFQRSRSGPIVRRTRDASEQQIVSPGEAERLELIGVTDGPDAETIFLRHRDDRVDLERQALGSSDSTVIGQMDRDGVAPEALSLQGNYVSAIYRDGAGAGWVTVSLTNGQKLYGTTGAAQGRCATVQPDCALAVTISVDGSTVYQVQAGEDPEAWFLTVHNAADFSTLDTIDLQRPAEGWFPTRIESTDGQVVVSRTASLDGGGDLSALVIDVESGEIRQLDRAGTAITIRG
ncbi:MAG: hypothetical protein HKN24_05730 [Acidimicrobiales bacterium]|nr:hypothetical protein [Acidimicrobiales bacterium]